MHDVRLDCGHQDASGERTRLAVGVQEALCASADRDRARDPARSRMAEPCHRYEAAQRRLHTLIRAVVPPIIFATVTVGIAKMGDMRRVGAVGVRAIIYFEVVSTIALVVGLIVGNLWQPGAGLHIAPASLDEKAVAGYISSAKSLTIVDFLMKMVLSNVVGAIAQRDLLPVL